MDEKNRKRYFLANEDLYQLTVDFECLLFAFEKLDRKFIGIEIDENYFNIAKNRMEIK